MPPELVDQMARDPGQLQHGAEERRADHPVLRRARLHRHLRGAQPEALREYINDYLTEMSVIIRSRHRGTLDKYIGDAIMAFWGAPVDGRAARAQRACSRRSTMQKPVRARSTQRFAARGWPALKIGVGVNSGTVRVGDMGSQLRRAYTAMGDAVNVASRLEGRTKHYGVGILVGEATRSRVQDVVFREIDRVKVKGKDEAHHHLRASRPGWEVDDAAGRAHALEPGAARLSLAQLGCWRR